MALEPEAASIYCQRESLEKLRFNQDQSKLTKPNTRYLVADIGGICNYITVYSQKRNAKYILGIIILIEIKFYLYDFGKCRTRFLIKLVFSLIANYGDYGGREIIWRECNGVGAILHSGKKNVHINGNPSARQYHLQQLVPPNMQNDSRIFQQDKTRHHAT